MQDVKAKPVAARRLPLPQPLLYGALIPLVSACSGEQHVLAPRGEDAALVANLTWALFAGATVIFLLVLALLTYALVRNRERRTRLDGNVFILLGGVLLPVVTLSVLLFFVFRIAATLSEEDADRMIVDVTAYQWWWEFTYVSPDINQQVTTANELHIPIGRQVELRLTSADVIHTFWVPNLGGKRDMIPGVTNTLLLQADEIGVSRGQCNEFCGAQHALMALQVVANTEAGFDSWLERQRQPAREPTNERQRRGREVFLSAGCALCHTVRGTGAFGMNGPDLTHFGSRVMLGAGTLVNTQQNLRAWIESSSHIKPENHMPDFALDAQDLDAVAAYVGSLE